MKTGSYPYDRRFILIVSDWSRLPDIIHTTRSFLLSIPSDTDTTDERCSRLRIQNSPKKNTRWDDYQSDTYHWPLAISENGTKRRSTGDATRTIQQRDSARLESHPPRSDCIRRTPVLLSSYEFIHGRRSNKGKRIVDIGTAVSAPFGFPVLR